MSVGKSFGGTQALGFDICITVKCHYDNIVLSFENIAQYIVLSFENSNFTTIFTGFQQD